MKKKIRKVAIIGSGWFGCHIAIFLLKKNIQVSVLEKRNDIFLGSSGFNQFRFHKGFHYPRSKSTINEIKINSQKFYKDYKRFIKFPSQNYYSIAKKESLIDFDTYKDILKANNIKFKNCKKSNFFNYDNLEGVVQTNEGVILNNKIKKFFKKKLRKKIIFNTEVKNIKKLKKDFDLVIDCTNNTFKNYYPKIINYVLTVSFIFKSKKNISLPSLTVMDGDLPSIYYYSDKKNYYTLTHSKYTHIKKFKNISNLEKFKKKIPIKMFNNLKSKSIASISKFYKNFEKKFLYKGHFLSYKILPIEQSDKRETYFYKDTNLLSFFSPKISNIFTAETIINKIIAK